MCGWLKGNYNTFIFATQTVSHRLTPSWPGCLLEIRLPGYIPNVQIRISILKGYRDTQCVSLCPGPGCSFLHLLLLNLWRLFCFSCLSCLGSLVKPQTDNCRNSSFERCFPKPYSLSRLEGKRREGVSRKGGWGNSGKKRKHKKRKRGRLGLTYTLPCIK